MRYEIVLVRGAFLSFVAFCLFFLFCCVEICIYVRLGSAGHMDERIDRETSFARRLPTLVNFNVFAFLLLPGLSYFQLCVCVGSFYLYAWSMCVCLCVCICLVKIMYIFSTFACFVFAYRV